MYARMPTVSVDNTVARTIALKLLSDLKNNLNVFSKAFIALENIYNQNTFESGVGSISIDRNSLEIPIVEKIEARIESKKLSGLTVTNFRNIDGNDITEPIFETKGLKIDTEFISNELVISIVYITKSKVNAHKLENYLKDHHVTKGSGFFHNVWYYYIIPDELLGLMEDIVSTRKINYDDGKTIIDFIRDGNTNNVIILRSDINGLEGDVGLAAINRARVHGIFDTELDDVKSEHDKDKNEWSVTVTYKTNYQSPESFLIDFEIACNNTLLEKYITERTNNPDVRREVDGLYPLDMTTHSYNYDYVAIPPFDNHKPIAFKSRVIHPLMSVMVLISNDDKRSLFNLKELEYYTIEDDVLEYIKNTKDHVVEPVKFYYKSMFKLDLYKDSVLMPRNMLSIDDDLNVVATVDLDITATYRCVLSLISNMNMIDPLYRDLPNTIISNDKLNIVYKGDAEKDIRVADENIMKDIFPVGKWRIITAQTSIVQTFIKENKNDS